MSKNYDLIVVGGGPGGYVAAIRAGQLGLKVACISKLNEIGGTCLNVGCIPSKTLLHATGLYHTVKEYGDEWGIQCKGIELDQEALQKKKNAIIQKFSKGIEGLLKKNKVDLIFGMASFVSNTELSVGNGNKTSSLIAKNIILATGSEPIELPFLQIDEKSVISSTGALSITKPPKKLLIIGGGVIGLELGSVFLRMGTEVSVIEALPEICPGLDQELCKTLRGSLEKQGMQFYLNSKVSESSSGKWTTTLKFKGEDGKEHSLGADLILLSIGRKPCTSKLNLEKVGVKLNDRGLVEVNNHLQTSMPNIYAIGDIVDGPMLAHKASEEGVSVVQFLAGQSHPVHYAEIPSVVYTHPEVASVGFTEEELKKASIPFFKGRFPFKANSRASCQGEEEGFVKVLGDKENGRLLGAHFIGASASEMISSATIALHLKAKVSDIGSICFPHPTLSEAFKEACLAATGAAIHL